MFTHLSVPGRWAEDNLRIRNSTVRMRSAYNAAITNAGNYESIFSVERIVDLNDLAKGDYRKAVNRHASVSDEVIGAIEEALAEKGCGEFSSPTGIISQYLHRIPRIGGIQCRDQCPGWPRSPFPPGF